MQNRTSVSCNHPIRLISWIQCYKQQIRQLNPKLTIYLKLIDSMQLHKCRLNSKSYRKS